MRNQTFLFYDVETTGLSKCFDQVIQFAAIRTDLNFNELSRHEFQIKKNSDVVPSPYAIITHHIGVHDMTHGLSELDAMEKIHALFNQPGTITLGYNTLGFDDELLRFSFYRNLLPPYTHQYANNCSRMDLYPITTLYYLFKRDALNWPITDGKVSLKLDAISQLNQLMTGRAHNAMVDVEATLALAKKLKTHEAMWDYACGYFNKQTDIERGDKLPIYFENDTMLFRDALLVNGKFGSAYNFIAPVLSLGQHHHYKNQTLWLRLDSETLLTTTLDTIPETTFVIRKKMAEQPFLLPPERRFLAAISEERLALAEKNKARLLSDEKLLLAIAEYHQDYKYPLVPNIDIDANLYNQSFPTSFEEKQHREFHHAVEVEKAIAARKLSSATRKEQALRVLARHYPQLLTEAELSDFDEYQQNPAYDFQGNKKLTWQAAREEALTIIKEEILTDEQQQLINQFLEVAAAQEMQTA